MNYYFAKDKYNRLLSYVFVSKNDPIIHKLIDHKFNRQKSIYYSEKEIQRIKFPKGTTFIKVEKKDDYNGLLHLTKKNIYA